ncbi:MAG: hypothetical protein ACI3Y4_06110 [Candidatus Cryptobacteroides sp.]
MALGLLSVAVSADGLC